MSRRPPGPASPHHTHRPALTAPTHATSLLLLLILTLPRASSSWGKHCHVPTLKSYSTLPHPCIRAHITLCLIHPGHTTDHTSTAQGTQPNTRLSPMTHNYHMSTAQDSQNHMTTVRTCVLLCLHPLHSPTSYFSKNTHGHSKHPGNTPPFTSIQDIRHASPTPRHMPPTNYTRTRTVCGFTKDMGCHAPPPWTCTAQ